MHQTKWLIIVFLLFAGCAQQRQEKITAGKVYYDLEGFFEQQINLLVSENPSLHKTGIIDGVKEEVDYLPDSSDWDRELNIFLSADLNKPRLLKSYKIDTVFKEGTQTLIYLSKRPGETLVDSLKIELMSNTKYPRSIYAMLQEHNRLFKSEKVFRLTFKANNNNVLLSTFEVNGWQKLVTKDTTHFDIRGDISPNSVNHHLSPDSL